MKRGPYSVNLRLIFILAFAVVLPSALLVLFGVRAVKNERFVLEHKLLLEYRQAARSLAHALDRELEEVEKTLPELRVRGNLALAGHPLVEMVFVMGPDRRVVLPARMPERRGIPAAFFRDFSGALTGRLAAEYRARLDKGPCAQAKPGLGSENPEEYSLALASWGRCRLMDGEWEDAIRAAEQLMDDSLASFSPLAVSAGIAGYFLLAQAAEQLNDARRYAEALMGCYRYMMSDTSALFLEECLYYSSRIESEMARIRPEALPLMVKEKRRRLDFNRFIRIVEKDGARGSRADSGYFYRDSVLFMEAPSEAGMGLGAVIKISGLQESIRRWEKERPHLGVLVSTSEGETLYSSFPAVFEEREAPRVTDGLCNRMPFLNMTVSEKKPGELHGILRYHRTLYLLFLCVLVAAIAIGVGLTYRAVRRELAVIRMRSNFISSVSHELKTPLTSIRMFSEMLQSGRATDEAKKGEYYGHIRREAERLTAIINKMLDFSKVEEGRIRYDFEPQDLEKVIDDALLSLAPLLDEKDVNITRERTRNLVVRCDRRMAAQVVVNLVDNAVKYSGERMEIEIKTSARESEAVCEIRDWGVGVEADETEKIFEEFYRSRSDRIREIKGTGLGLAIARKIVTDHRGRINAVPAEGGGLRVIFTLPLEGKT